MTANLFCWKFCKSEELSYKQMQIVLSPALDLTLAQTIWKFYWCSQNEEFRAFVFFVKKKQIYRVPTCEEC